MSKRVTALGLMSGTSLDGIDVALIVTDGEDIVERGPSATYAYRPDQQALLQEALADARPVTDRNARPGILAQAERELSAWHIAAVERFCREKDIARSTVEVVGFHGQTVLHRPEIRLTLQLGDGPALARAIGTPVIYDMRAADVAAGGQGAPLVPIYHRALAAGLGERPVSFINIGGVANLTWISGAGELLAFDTGPGNALLNDWCERHLDVPYDRDGTLAARGSVHNAALKGLAQSPYFDRPIPKSLDRNGFDISSLEGLTAEDGAATLSHFTATSIARGMGHVPERPKLHVICGGGRLNPTLMKIIKGLLEPMGDRVIAAEDAGFDGDAMEAEAWAYLAVRCMRGLPITFPGTTGAPRPMSGGVVARP